MQHDAHLQNDAFFQKETQYLEEALSFAQTVAKDCEPTSLYSDNHSLYKAVNELALCYDEWLRTRDPALTEHANQLLGSVAAAAEACPITDTANLSSWQQQFSKMEYLLSSLCTPEPDEAGMAAVKAHAKWLQLWKCVFHLMEYLAVRYQYRLQELKIQYAQMLDTAEDSLSEKERAALVERIDHTPPEQLEDEFRHVQFLLDSSASMPHQGPAQELPGTAGELLEDLLHTGQQAQIRIDGHHGMGKSAFGLFKQLMEKRRFSFISNVDQVHFSALTSQTVEPGCHYKLQLFMYPKEQREVVEEIIRQAEEKLLEEKTDLPVSIRRKQNITVRLTSGTAEISDSEMTLPWTGTAQEFRFSYYVPANAAGKNLSITANIYVDEVIATRLEILIPLKAANSCLQIVRQDIRRAFVSYAHEDFDTVMALRQGIQFIRPDLDLFTDVFSLRQGEQWAPRLHAAIDDCQALYLCWSRKAKASKWVNREWRYAYTSKGSAGVEPIPLEPPELCSPPYELADRHFNDISAVVRYAYKQIGESKAAEQNKTQS